MTQTHTPREVETPQSKPAPVFSLRCSCLCGVKDWESNGNLTSTRLQAAASGPVSNLAYDSQNRLLSASDGTHNVTSTYDTRNRVTSRTTDGVTTLFLWDGWNLIEERDLTGAQTRRYVHGAAVDEILLMVDAAGAKYYLHDALGSTTALTDSSGAIVESYLYDVFGKPSFFSPSGSAQSASSVDNRFLYTGREWIAEAQLYDYRNRVYSPAIGRFMQIDPIRFNAGDVNMYRYVGNRVTFVVDPTGLIGSGVTPTGNGWVDGWTGQGGQYTGGNVVHGPVDGLLHYLTGGGSHTEPKRLSDEMRDSISRMLSDAPQTSDPTNITIAEASDGTTASDIANIGNTLGQFRYTREGNDVSIDDHYAFPLSQNDWNGGTSYHNAGLWLLFGWWNEMFDLECDYPVHDQWTLP